MARSLGNAPSESILPSITPQQAMEFLRRQCEKGGDLLKNRPLREGVYRVWENTSRGFLAKAFGSDPLSVSGFIDIGATFRFTTAGLSEEYREKSRVEALNQQLAWLDSMLDVLQTEIELNSSQVSSKIETSIGNSVFLVHGHNEGIRETVARFLEHLDLRVIILHEQPDRGRIIIEKFEDHSKEAGFAVVLLTGDDRGGLKEEDPSTYQLRARQNVILELGFFLNALGRDRVCALYEDGVDIPSDYQGVLFIKLDSDWKLKLARELKEAGFLVDLNKALS